MKPSSSFLLAPLAIRSIGAVGSSDPLPKAEPTLTEDFIWSDPFASPDIGGFTATCTAERTFPALEFLLHDLSEQEPTGLGPYGEALKSVFSGRPYPGGWEGIDPHLYDRPLLRMNYIDVPLRVREWIENEERTEGDGEGLFAVYNRAVEGTRAVRTASPPNLDKIEKLRPLDENKIVIFAPGAMYDILPLWVAEGSECQESLLELSRYGAQPTEGGIIAWTTSHTTPNRKDFKRDATFTIKAQVLARDSGQAQSLAEPSRSVKEEL